MKANWKQTPSGLVIFTALFENFQCIIHLYRFCAGLGLIHLGTRIADRDRSQSSYTSNTLFDPCKIGLVCPPTIEIPTYRYKLEGFFI